MKPNTTCTPARSRSRAQRMFASSSKRALSSISAVTDLPASAASISVLTIGDSADVGVAGGLLQELHHDVEGFVWVVDHKILLPDRGKAVAAMIADALGIAGIV